MSELSKKRAAGSGIRVLLSLACFVIVVTGMRAAAEIFIPVLLGLFFAILSLPVLNWLYARGMPRPLAIVMTILVDFLVLGVIVYIVSGVIPEFQDKKVDYAESLKELTSDFSETMDSQLERFSGFWTRETDFGKGDNKVVEENGENGSEGNVSIVPDPNIPTFKELFNRYWDTNRIVAAIGSTEMVARFTSITSKSFFALIIMIFILAESGRYTNKVRDVIRVGGPNLKRFQNSSSDIQKYLGIKTVASATTGVLAGTACVIFGVDFPVLWGLVAFLFNYVPVIGSIVAAVPAVILALIESGFWPAFGVFACYLAINVTIGNFIEPMLLGRKFGLSTVVVILSVMVWGFIWGPVGMFLAVPLTMVIKVMFDHSSDLRWISVIMGKGGAAPILRKKRMDAAKASQPENPLPDPVQEVLPEREKDEVSEEKVGSRPSSVG